MSSKGQADAWRIVDAAEDLLHIAIRAAALVAAIQGNIAWKLKLTPTQSISSAS